MATPATTRHAGLANRPWGRIVSKLSLSAALVAAVIGCVRPSTDVRSTGACRDGLRFASVANRWTRTVEVFVQSRTSTFPVLLGSLEPGARAEYAVPNEGSVFGRTVHPTDEDLSRDQRLPVVVKYECR